MDKEKIKPSTLTIILSILMSYCPVDISCQDYMIFVDEFYSLMNSLSQSEKQSSLMSDKLLENYFDQECIVTNDLTQEGTESLRAYEYLDMIRILFANDKNPLEFKVLVKRLENESFSVNYKDGLYKIYTEVKITGQSADNSVIKRFSYLNVYVKGINGGFKIVGTEKTSKKLKNIEKLIATLSPPNIASVSEKQKDEVNKEENTTNDIEFIRNVSVSDTIVNDPLVYFKSIGQKYFLYRGADKMNDEYFDEVRTFHEGIAAVRRGNHWSFINQNGKLLSDFIFLNVRNFSENRAIVKIHEFSYVRALYSIMDRDGNILVSPKYRSISDFRNGLAKADTYTFRTVNIDIDGIEWSDF